LLSREPDEAIAMVEKHLDGGDLISACDNLLLPAIVLWEKDRAAGLLSEEEQNAFRENLGGLTEFLLDAGTRTEGVQTAVESPEVVFVPATDDTDSMVGGLLARIAVVHGLKASNIESGGLVSETIDGVAALNGATVVISAVPPVAPARLRYLLRKMEERGAGRRVLVGAWKGQEEWEEVSGALPKGGSARAVTTLREVLDAVS
jgi:hypothetical protein